MSGQKYDGGELPLDFWSPAALVAIADVLASGATKLHYELNRSRYAAFDDRFDYEIPAPLSGVGSAEPAEAGVSS